MISQEQLVRKAASLCYLLSNEGTVSLVGLMCVYSEGIPPLNALSSLLLCIVYIGVSQPDLPDEPLYLNFGFCDPFVISTRVKKIQE